MENAAPYIILAVVLLAAAGLVIRLRAKSKDYSSTTGTGAAGGVRSDGGGSQTQQR